MKTKKMKTKKVVSWLDEQSELYTKIMEEPVTRGTVLLVNLIAICIIIVAVAAGSSLLISFAAALCAGYLVKRLIRINE